MAKLPIIEFIAFSIVFHISTTVAVPLSSADDDDIIERLDRILSKRGAGNDGGPLAAGGLAVSRNTNINVGKPTENECPKPGYKAEGTPIEWKYRNGSSGSSSDSKPKDGSGDPSAAEKKNPPKRNRVKRDKGGIPNNGNNGKSKENNKSKDKNKQQQQQTVLQPPSGAQRPPGTQQQQQNPGTKTQQSSKEKQKSSEKNKQKSGENRQSSQQNQQSSQSSSVKSSSSQQTSQTNQQKKSEEKKKSKERRQSNEKAAKEEAAKLNEFQKEVDRLFEEFMKRYGKTYNDQECAMRQSIFDDNNDRMNKLNSDKQKRVENEKSKKESSNRESSKQKSKEKSNQQSSSQQSSSQQSSSNQQSSSKQSSSQQTSQQSSNQQQTNQQTGNQQSPGQSPWQPQPNPQLPNQPPLNQKSKEKGKVVPPPVIVPFAPTSVDDAVAGINKFSDQKYSEFSQSSTGAQPETGVHFDITPQQAQQLSKEVPVHVDWRSKGTIGAVRNQGSCGSCYAFSAADLVSLQNAVERQEKARSLSPQYVMNCASENRGCQGARVGKVLQELVNGTGGVPLEQCEGYEAKPGTCARGKSCCLRQKIKWFQILDISNSHEKEIMGALMEWGPVIVVVEVSEAWQFYNGTGIIKASQCPSGKQNHAVTLVGYNFDPQQTATPFYLVRNSWGNDWGNNGYAKLEAGKNACQVAKAVFTAYAFDEKFKDAKSKVLGGLSPYKSEGQAKPH